VVRIGFAGMEAWEGYGGRNEGGRIWCWSGGHGGEVLDLLVEMLGRRVVPGLRADLCNPI
jgi:hypothetical protein